MTRLDAMRALLAIQFADDHQRVSRAIEGYETADAEKVRIEAVRIKTKRRTRKKSAKASRIGWLKGVHGKGA